jgi:hypothetical protein
MATEMRSVIWILSAQWHNGDRNALNHTGTTSPKSVAQHDRNGWHNGDRIIHSVEQIIVDGSGSRRTPTLSRPFCKFFFCHSFCKPPLHAAHGHAARDHRTSQSLSKGCIPTRMHRTAPEKTYPKQLNITASYMSSRTNPTAQTQAVI